MKKHLIWLMAALMTCSLSIMFTACSSDDDLETGNNDEKTLFDDCDISKIKVVSSGEIALYEELQKCLQEAQAGNSDEDEMAQAIYTRCIENLKQYAEKVAAEEGSNGYTDFMKRFKLGYSRIDIVTRSYDGTEINMSTLIAWPELLWEHRADHVILGCHATVTEDKATPSHFSKDFSMQTDIGMILGAWAAFGGSYECLVVFPDYEGYGSTKDRCHPYLNREVQARQCVDALIQSIYFYNQIHKGLVDNYKIASVGYSQGGAVSAAAYRYCLDNPEVRKTLPTWNGAVCGDGPYDPYATILEYCEKDKLYLPCAPILMLKGLCETDSEMIEAGCKPADFLSTWTMESGILERLASKEYPSHDCDALLFGYGQLHPNTFTVVPDEEFDSGRYYLTSQVLNKETYDFFKSKGQTLPADENLKKKVKVLEHCLKKNALWYKDDNTIWTPPTDAHFTFFHSKRDEVVGFTNMQSLVDKWGSTNANCQFVEYDTRTYQHTGTGKAFFMSYTDGFIKEILKNTWESGYSKKEPLFW